MAALRQFEAARTRRDLQKNWKWGWSYPERLAKAQDFLLKLGVIKTATPVERMYSNAFLPD
jgi:hypothetical protein